MKKFTLFIMMLVAYVATTFAQTPISSPSDVTPGKIYWMSNGQYADWEYGSAMYFDRIFGDRIALGYFGQYGEGRGGFEDNPEDPDQQFAFIEYRGNLYLYSIGADNFVAHKDDGVFLMDSPTNYVTITENAGTLPDFPWNLKFDGTMFIGGHWGLPENGCLTCSDGNTTSKSYTWQIFEMGEMKNLDEVTKRLAKNMGKFDDEVAIALLPDHPTPCRLKTHTAAPVPFVIYKPGVTADKVVSFDEQSVKEGYYGELYKDEFITELFK